LIVDLIAVGTSSSLLQTPMPFRRRIHRSTNICKSCGNRFEIAAKSLQKRLNATQSHRGS
jgi:transcription elongation factor Elf1